MRWYQPTRHTSWRVHGGMLAGLGTFVCLVVLLTGCGASTPSAASVLKSGQQTFAATTAFHFTLATQHPGSAPSLSSLYPTQADGDVVRPNKIRATVSVALGALTVTTQIIAIGNQAWFLDPTSNTWQPVSGVGALTNLFDSRKGIGSLLTEIQNPSVPSDRSLAGTHCWFITGTLAANTVAGLIGSASASTAPLKVGVCIGEDNHQLYLVTLTGVLIPGDTAQTEHDFTLSKFDESVTITPPAGK